MSRLPTPRPYRDIIGEVVLKPFGPHGTFMGTVVEYDEKTGFRVQFDDGDTEDVSLADLTDLLPAAHSETTRPPAPAPASKPSAKGAPTPKAGANPKPPAPSLKKEEASTCEAAPRPAVAPPPRKKMLLEQLAQQSAAADAASDGNCDGPLRLGPLPRHWPA